MLFRKIVWNINFGMSFFIKGQTKKNILFSALNISIYNTEYINVIKQDFL